MSRCAGRAVAIVTLLLVFMVALALMEGSLRLLTACSAGELFHAIDNPVAGLVAGIVATVLVQSSSTSTSIVVDLVAAGALSVRHAIPVVMGANIGTSVTNTLVRRVKPAPHPSHPPAHPLSLSLHLYLSPAHRMRWTSPSRLSVRIQVSLGQMGDPAQYERAFAGASKGRRRPIAHCGDGPCG